MKFQKQLFSLFLVFSIVVFQPTLFGVIKGPSAARFEESQGFLNQIAHYLIPESDPRKQKLDAIFSSSRVLLNLDTFRAAGFKTSGPRKYTKIIVATHPQFPGTIFKLFLDSHRYDYSTPFYQYWIKRINGARLIQQKINERGWQNLFKVPVKWLYKLPANPQPSSDFAAKNYLLVQDDMNIYSDEINRDMWKGDAVTPELLTAFFILIKETGFSDIKPDNTPFSRDGRIAFVDTQTFNRKVEFKKFLSALSIKNRALWSSLIRNPPP